MDTLRHSSPPPPLDILGYSSPQTCQFDQVRTSLLKSSLLLLSFEDLKQFVASLCIIWSELATVVPSTSCRNANEP